MFVFAFACGFAAARAYLRLPARWLCDYGEAPSMRHLPSGRAMPVWGSVCMGLACAGASVGAMRGLLFAGTGRAVLAAALFSVLCAVLLLAAWCDAVYAILPDELLALAAALAVLFWLLRAAAWQPRWYSPLAGAAAGFAGMWCVQLLAARVYKTEAMGFGDVKLLGVLGLVCGPTGLGVCVLLAVFSAALVFSVLLLLHRVRRRSLVPFGPFLVAGALAALALRPEWCALARWYFGLL